jgi:hypothetical protein
VLILLLRRPLLREMKLDSFVPAANEGASA